MSAPPSEGEVGPTAARLPTRISLVTARQTTSVCPECSRLVPAVIYDSRGKMFMKKTCSEHGQTISLLSSDSKLYEESFLYNFPGKLHLIKSHAAEYTGNCPLDCGICPEHLQHTCASIVEVTNRCNLNCPVCYMRANEGPEKIPSLDEIRRTFDLLLRSETSPPSLTITGGEPTLRDDLVEIIRLAKSMGFVDISLSTNGVIPSKKPELFRELADAGLTEVSISFDGFSDDVFLRMRGVPLLATKVKAVDAALAARLSVTVSCTIIDGINSDQIGALIQFAKEKRLDGVNLSPVAFVGRYPKEIFSATKRVTIADVLRGIEAQTSGELAAGDFVPVPCPDNRCSTMTYVFNDGKKLEPLTDYCDVRSYLDVYGEKATCCDWVFAALDKLWSMSAVPGSAKVLASAGSLSPQGHSADEVMTISVHSFQDPWTLDVQRLKKCCIHVAEPDRIVPFCAYNNLYREADASPAAHKPQGGVSDVP